MRRGTIIYDIEASSTNINKAIPRIIGWWSTLTKEYYWTTDLSIFQQALNQHKFVSGWNINGYDNPILIKHGLTFKGMTVLDTMEIIHGSGFGADKGRIGIMQDPEGNHLARVLHSKKMSDMAKIIGCTQKMEFEEYDWFKKPFDELTDEQQKIAHDYLEADVLASRDILDYVENFFKDFKDGGIYVDDEMAEYGFGKVGDFIPYNLPQEIENKTYLTRSVASWTYGMLCNICKLPREFNNSEKVPFGGGYVSPPFQVMNERQKGEEWEEISRQGAIEGDIYCLDYNSLYPHIMIQMNLYGGKCNFQYDVADGVTRFHTVFPTSDIAVRGQGLCETDGYYETQISKPSLLLKKLYKLRNEYKNKKDERQYTVKIVINTVYGLLGNPSFKSVASYISANDCTKLGRQWVNEARRYFAENGYEIIYTDTDSIYFRDPYKDKDKMLKIKDEHIKKIKSQCLFPVDTFDMGVDAEIDYMFFVKGANGSWAKKNYFYVKRQKDGSKSLEITGHAIGNSKSSPLSKAIFDKHIKQKVIEGEGNERHKFRARDIENWISEELRANPMLIAKRYNIKEADDYTSKTSLHYQICVHKNGGSGTMDLVKLKVPHELGAGKNDNYINVKHIDKVSINQIDLDSVWSDLEPFIKNEQKGLNAFM